MDLRDICQCSFGLQQLCGMGSPFPHQVAFASFRDIASNSVKQLLAKTGHSGDSEQAAADVIKGFEEVQAHSDVLPGLRAIHDAGIKVGNPVCALLLVLPQCAVLALCQ